MQKEGGFNSLVIVLAVGFLILGIYLGQMVIKPLVSGDKETSQADQLKPKESTASSQAKSSDLLDPPQQTNNPYKYSKTGDNYLFTGNYPIGDYDKVTYTVVFPKKGGAISGQLTGACTGSVTGNMAVPDSDGESKITGNLAGKCKPVPRFSFEVDVASTFEGLVNQKTGKIQITHDTTKPISWRGYFEFYFTP